MSTVKLTSHHGLAHRLVLSALTGCPVRIADIRSSSATAPGLTAAEVSLLRLLEAVTNGTDIEISYTGTVLLFKPGLIVGSGGAVVGADAVTSGSSRPIRHEVPAACGRAASYFLLPLCLLAPFSKGPVNVVLTGPGVVTGATDRDVSVDTVRTAVLPLFERFLGPLSRGRLEIRILRRAAAGPRGRSGGGEVQLLFRHQVRLPATLHWLNPGRVRRVRGVASAIGVSSMNNARMIEAARGVLNQFVPDTYIFSDTSSAPTAPDPSNATGRKKTGLGFALSLVAESSTGALFSADAACPPTGGEPPEAVGRRAALQLLDSIADGGCVSRLAAPTLLSLMAMGGQDVGRVRVSRALLTDPEIIRLARDLAAFGLAGWGVRAVGGSEGNEDEDRSEDESETGGSGGKGYGSVAETDLILSIVGRGIGNVGRKVA